MSNLKSDVEPAVKCPFCAGDGRKIKDVKVHDAQNKLVNHPVYLCEKCNKEWAGPTEPTIKVREVFPDQVLVVSPELKISKREDGVWLEFKTKGGNYSTVNLSQMKDEGPLSNDVLVQWAQEFADRAEFPTRAEDQDETELELVEQLNEIRENLVQIKANLKPNLPTILPTVLPKKFKLVSYTDLNKKVRYKLAREDQDMPRYWSGPTQNLWISESNPHYACWNTTDQTEAEWKRAFELFNAFDVDKGVEDIAATIAAIRTDSQCSGKVGAVGYCLGGLLAYLTAATVLTSFEKETAAKAIESKILEMI